MLRLKSQKLQLQQQAFPMSREQMKAIEVSAPRNEYVLRLGSMAFTPTTLPPATPCRRCSPRIDPKHSPRIDPTHSKRIDPMHSPRKTQCTLQE
eukprot:scaffold6900_cov76-Isochrysis_galbana.AAC.2